MKLFALVSQIFSCAGEHTGYSAQRGYILF